MFFFPDSLIFKKIGFHLLIYYLHPRILFFFKGSEGNLSAKPWYHTLIIGKSREKKTHKLPQATAKEDGSEES